MSEDKKKTRAELEMHCRNLQRMTEHMAMCRYILTKYTIRHSIYIIFFMLAVLTMYFTANNLLLLFVFFAFSFIMTPLLYVYTTYLQKPYYKDYKETNKNARGVVSNIINIVDWGQLRKQQYYKGTDEKVAMTLRAYFDEIQMKMSPGRKQTDYCSYIIVYQILIRYVCFILSFYFLMHSLLK